jgi:DNA sulfur modification protein DndD
MKLLSVDLENIFAYYGSRTIDLSETTPERNIVLIWGRNGYGKTSFLNAVKLLFTGTDNPRYRMVGFPAQTLSLPEYVQGRGAHWLGLINRQAQRRSTGTLSARVGALLEADGLQIRADRTWIVESGRISEQLIVFDGQQRLTGEAAEERLEDILPKEFASFFFFDGEDIKSMAERIEQKTIEFDRLLRLTYLSDAADELGKLAQERLKRGLEADLIRQLGEAESALGKATRGKEADEKQLAETEERLFQDETELRRLQTRRETLSSGASEAQRAELESRRKQVGDELGELRAKIAETVVADAPIVANLRLVEAALKSVDQRIAMASSAEVVLIRQIKDELPAWIEEGAPELAEGKRLQLAQALTRRLEGLVREPASEGLLAGLDVARAERLRATLLRWAAGGPDRRNLQAAQLAEAAGLQLELDQIGEALIRIEVGSQSNLEEYRRVMLAITELEGKVSEQNQRKGALTDRIEVLGRDIEELARKLKALRDSQERASKNAEEARFIQRVAKAMNDLREAARRESRATLETLINAKFKALVSGHALIDRIELDDEYTMSFRDAGGNLVGRASLSSGLKQLAATALLWAMKDAAAVDMPVIIDTPLGRIDKANQDNLLNNYYPALSHQVIVLPTDSEIDGRKHDLLIDRIASEYRIENESGDRAQVNRIPLKGAH